MGGLFVSDNYHPEPLTTSDSRIVSVTWGFTLGFSFLTGVKAAKQTITVWRRAHRMTTYTTLLWVEMLSSTGFGFLAWFFLNGYIEMSLWLLLGIVTCWVLQIQCLLQIIINRLAILIINKRKLFWIKWGTAATILGINISVYCIWIPARLQINEQYIHVNAIWDRIEKAIYLVVDGILNAYFLYLVKSKLMANGMTKYKPLFNFNAVIVFVSLSMDVLIIAMMSLPNDAVYMQFHPIAYMVKLNIEMTMAELVTRIAQSSNHAAPNNLSSSGPHTITGDDPTTGVSRAWYRSKKNGNSNHNRIHSHTKKSQIKSQIRNSTDDMHITGVTSPPPDKGYTAWVRAGGRESRDIEAQKQWNNSHFEEDDDDLEGKHAGFEMKAIDFLRGGGKKQRYPQEEKGIMKTMETVITTHGIDEGQEDEESDSVPGTTANGTHTSSETESTRELTKEP